MKSLYKLLTFTEDVKSTNKSTDKKHILFLFKEGYIIKKSKIYVLLPISTASYISSYLYNKYKDITGIKATVTKVNEFGITL